jgi:hypothetical protein
MRDGIVALLVAVDIGSAEIAIGDLVGFCLDHGVPLLPSGQDAPSAAAK